MIGFRCDNCNEWSDGPPIVPSFTLPITLDIPLVEKIRVNFDVLVNPSPGQQFKYMDLCPDCRSLVQSKLIEKLVG